MLLGGVAAGLFWTLLPGTTPALAGATARVDDPGAVVITDGDTFRYRGDKIRIADIDAPEVRGRCEREIRLAARATERMANLLAAGPFELRMLGRDVDRYGRKLRVVVRDGRSLGDQLVAEGLARTWTGRREPWC
jgi:endonuclease YncB( thermonuclease family)